ncbi:MAG TPA: alpha/beta hydrolase [Herminiimonas sp.]|nr:alpha/beta hydrolase [Herminiimonas sp.]
MNLQTTDIAPAGMQTAEPLNLWFERPESLRKIGLRLFGHRSRRSPVPVIVYFHGGTFNSGAIDDANGIAGALAEHAVVVLVDYPLAPDAVFPEMADIAFEAVQWAHANAVRFGGIENDIVVAGDEAGGNLAAAVAMIARDRIAAAGHGFYLNGQILISPMLDPNQTSASMQEKGECYCQKGWAAYLPFACDAMHPYAAPAQSKRLGGLAPALIITAESNPLRDEAEQYAARLIAAGVPVQVRRFEGASGNLVQPQHDRFGSVISTIAQFIHDPA